MELFSAFTAISTATRSIQKLSQSIELPLLSTWHFQVAVFLSIISKPDPDIREELPLRCTNCKRYSETISTTCLDVLRRYDLFCWLAGVWISRGSYSLTKVDDLWPKAESVFWYILIDPFLWDINLGWTHSCFTTAGGCSFDRSFVCTHRPRALLTKRSIASNRWLNQRFEPVDICKRYEEIKLIPLYLLRKRYNEINLIPLYFFADVCFFSFV